MDLLVLVPIVNDSNSNNLQSLPQQPCVRSLSSNLPANSKGKILARKKKNFWREIPENFGANRRGVVPPRARRGCPDAMSADFVEMSAFSDDAVLLR